MIVALALLACTPAAVSGTVVDVRGGVPVGLRVTATPTDGPCPPMSSDVVDGAFGFDEPCRGPYRLSLEAPGFSVWGPPEPLRATVEVRAWPVAEGLRGVAITGPTATPGAVEPLAAVSTARTSTRQGATVRYPDVLPAENVGVPSDGWLFSAGAPLAGRVMPLVAEGSPPWPVLGDAVPVPASCVESGDESDAIVGCPASAFAPGDYAVVDGDRLVIVRISAGSGGPSGP